MGIDPIKVIEQLKRQIGDMAQSHAMLQVLLAQAEADRDNYRDLAQRVENLERE